MKPTPFNFPLCILLLGMILGIIGQDLLNKIGIAMSLLLSGIAVGGIYYCHFRLKKFLKETVFLAGMSLGILAYNIHYEPNDSKHYLHKLSPEKAYSLVGRIEHIKNRQVIVALQPTETANYRGKLVLYLKDTLRENALGQAILFHSKLSPIAAAQNPYQFDYKRYMEHQGIYWQGYPTCYEIKDAPSFSPFIKAKQLQGYLAATLSHYTFSKETVGVLKALVLGVRSDITPELYQQYINAGAVHILAISGLHIGIITYLLTLFISLVVPAHRKGVKIALLLVSLLTYAAITGFSASVLRAVVMFGGYSIAYLAESRRARYDSLLLSAFILLLCKPTFLFEVGFQLSYMAVLSIALFLPLGDKYRFENRFLNFFWDIIKVSIAAQIGVLPLSLYYFHQFAGLFLVTNVLILPLLGIILSVGIGVVLLASIQLLPYWLLVCYEKALSLMNHIIGYIASVEQLVIRDVYFDTICLCLCYLAIVWAIIYLRARKIKFVYFFFLTLLSLQTYFFHLKYESAKKEQLIVFHQYKKTVIALQQGREATFYLSDTLSVPQTLIKNFCTQQQVSNLHYKALENIVPFKEDFLTIIDDKFYLDTSYPTHYLLLRNNPKIHLEKFLSNIRPKMLIADGSNYPFIIEKWKYTCQRLQIPFYDTKIKPIIVTSDE
ncbi:ComEC/Rec2 family competence protein [Capnocytophaga granulosa]|uniref:ComEC/Rec2 family competence protein n=1 Tax=Capnocytophaga granulosa TaxID=45242 RepID=UPI0028D3A68C|nr:ComEC/Rec2 family competence protein [Capnocytophaga granulosa]